MEKNDKEIIKELGHLSTCCEAEIIMGCEDMGKCKDCGENTTSIRYQIENQGI